MILNLRVYGNHEQATQVILFEERPFPGIVPEKSLHVQVL